MKNHILKIIVLLISIYIVYKVCSRLQNVGDIEIVIVGIVFMTAAVIYLYSLRNALLNISKGILINPHNPNDYISTIILIGAIFMIIFFVLGLTAIVLTFLNITIC